MVRATNKAKKPDHIHRTSPGWAEGQGLLLTNISFFFVMFFCSRKKYIPCRQIPDCGFGKTGSLKRKVHLPRPLT